MAVNQPINATTLPQRPPYSRPHSLGSPSAKLNRVCHHPDQRAQVVKSNRCTKPPRFGHASEKDDISLTSKVKLQDLNEERKGEPVPGERWSYLLPRGALHGILYNHISWASPPPALISHRVCAAQGRSRNWGTFSTRSKRSQMRGYPIPSSRLPFGLAVSYLGWVRWPNALCTHHTTLFQSSPLRQ